MPLTRLAVDALGVVTISLVALLSLFGLFCIIYTLYLRSRIQRSGFVRLGYFNGPWIIRIVLVLIGIWWGIGEVIRLSFLRQRGSFFNSLGPKWQEDLCKYYVLSNLGFAEPCMFLTMSFLLRASLQWRGSGTLNRRWNYKTVGYILLYCLPVFILDFIFLWIGPKFVRDKRKSLRLPYIFTRTHSHHSDGELKIAVCTYPLLCTILYGLFTVALTTYLLLLGRRVVSSVINKGLQRRVYILIFLISSFLPARIVLLGFSVLANGGFLVEALAFGSFLVLLCCIVVGLFTLVYLPVSDSLALRRGLRRSAEEGDGGSGSLDEETAVAVASTSMALSGNDDSIALISSPSRVLDVSAPTSVGRNSDASTKRGSISFRTMIRDEACATGGGGFEEEMSSFALGSNTNQSRLSSWSPPRTPFLVG